MIDHHLKQIFDSAKSKSYQVRWDDSLKKVPSRITRKIPTERAFAAVGKVDGSGTVMLCGGLDKSSIAVATCDKYTRTVWQGAEPMLHARAKMAYSSDGQRMYVAGGLGASGSPIDSVEMYEIGSWTARKSLPSGTSG